MPDDLIGGATGNVNEEELPTKTQADYENDAYDTGEKTLGIPNAYWKALTMGSMGRKPLADANKYREETWTEESLRKMAQAFKQQHEQEYKRQLIAGAKKKVQELTPQIENYHQQVRIDPTTGIATRRYIHEHPEFGTWYRAHHVLGTKNFEAPVDDLHPNMMHPLLSDVDLKESPYTKGKELEPGEKFAFLHRLMSGANDDETKRLREEHSKDSYIKSLLDTFGYNESTGKYFFRDKGSPLMTEDKSKYASKQFPYRPIGKFMRALGSVSNKEIPEPQYREVSVLDDERTKTAKNVFNHHLRNASAFAVPAIAAGRAIGSMAAHALKPVAPLGAPMLGAIASMITPTIVGTLMHKYADSKANEEMRHKRFGPNPYDIIRKGY